MTDNNAADSVLHNISEQQNYARRRYGYNRNSHWWGKAHRARLIATGEYIKTSEQPRLRIRWKDPTPLTAHAVREAWGEVIRLAQENS